MHYSSFYKHSNFKNEIRNSRYLKSNKKNENRKFENNYVLSNIFVTITHKKKKNFDEKSFFDKFICRLSDIYQKLIDI